MAVPPAVELDVRLIAHHGHGLLLARAAGQAWHTLPGGLVREAEGVERALVRHLGPLAEPIAGSWAFAGAVEHTGDAGETGGIDDADHLADDAWAWGAPAAEHVLTLLFAVEWPAGVPIPTSWNGREIREVDDDELVVTRLAPLPVAWAARRWLMDGHPHWRRLAPAAAQAAWHGGRPPVASLRAQLAARRDQFRGRRFRDAAVAMCALVAAADGRIDPAERDGLQAFLATDPVMTNFSATELEQLFDRHLERLRTDPENGRRIALGDIARLRNQPAEAAAVLRLGEVIGRIDGAFPPVEQAVLREAAAALGIGSPY
ncbi:MAG: TerB family tellurite resistance protein [Frankia sp.]|nr:TerB family tellurite resistance protein [Frankia sp.]